MASQGKSKLTRKYGLITAICFVVGTVIGSGIFFKAEGTMARLGSNIALSILAWALGGAIMLAFTYSFSILATRHEKVNGMVDYGETLVGKGYGYMLGWFLGLVYFPIIAAVLAFVSANFTSQLFNLGAFGQNATANIFVPAMAAVYFIGVYAMNALSPKLGGKFHVSATFIKVIPLILLAVIGTIWGLASGTTVTNVTMGFSGAPQFANDSVATGFFYALVASAFAYAGWEVGLGMNSEIKNSKKNLPKALIVGGLIVVGIYVAYLIGLFSTSYPPDMAGSGGSGAGTRDAFMRIFGGPFGTILFVFIVISCLGTLNGLVMALNRQFYSLGARGRGPAPQVFRQVDKKTNVPNNSAVIGLLVGLVWLFVFIVHMFPGWTGFVMPLNSVVIIIYNFTLTPILVFMMIKEKDLHWAKRFLAPGITIAGSLFAVIANIYVQRLTFLWFLLVVIGILGVGLFTYMLRIQKKELKNPIKIGKFTILSHYPTIVKVTDQMAAATIEDETEAGDDSDGEDGIEIELDGGEEPPAGEAEQAEPAFAEDNQ